MQFLARLILTFFAMLGGLAHASERIEVVWGFAPGGSQANIVRQIIQQANSDQNRIQFVFLHKPGAGGSIAANHVSSNPNTAVVAMSSSFIIRPKFERGVNTHNLDDFAPVIVQSTGAPLFVVSNKISSPQQLLKSTKLTIGVSGVGGIGHLAANELAKKIPDSILINFSNMVDAMTAAAGGHVDIAVGFYGDVQALVESGKLQVIGYTGDKKLERTPGVPLKDFGIAPTFSSHAIYISNRMDRSLQKDIREILYRANQSPAVSELYLKDLMTKSDLDALATQKWYDQQRSLWQDKVKNITPIQSR